MSRLATILLVLLAAGAATFLFVVEPRWESTRERLATRDFVFNVDPGAVRGVRIATGDDSFELTRGEDGWRVGPKPRDAASPEKVGKLLAAAVNLRVHDVIRAAELTGDRDLGDFGLAKPRNRLDLLGDGEATLFFGKDAAAEGRIYVRRSDSNDIYVVDDTLQQLAFRSAQDFRDRRLSSVAPERVDRFTIKRDGGEITLERGGQGWRIMKPFRARADEAAVNRLLGEVLGLSIQEFVADESNELGGQARAEIVLELDDSARPLALRLAGPPAADGSVTAQFTARDSIYKLPGRTWSLLQTSPDDLRDRRLVALNLDTIDAVRLRDGDRTRQIERAGEAWREEGRDVPASVLEELARAVSEAKVGRYLPLTAENLRATGLDQPRGEIAFDAWLSENTPETTAGRRPVVTVAIGKHDGPSVYVRVNDEPEICVIPAETLNARP